jgi:hypothetical protein
MAASTGQAIREELLKWGVLRLLGTTVGTSATSYLSDTVRFSSNAHSSTMYEDCWVRLTSGTLAGEISKVDYLDQTNGRLYVTPVWTGTPAASVTYEIIRHGIEPDDLDRARDEGLTRYCSQWAKQPLSELTNADYEDAIGTTWTTPVTGTETINVDIGFPFGMVGRNTLRLTSAAVDDYLQSTSIYPRPNQSFYLYVPVSCRVGAATVVVRDVTNSVNIALNGTATSAGRGWSGIEVTGRVPATCYELAVRLVSSLATAIIDWGPIHFRWQGQRNITLPDRIDSRKHVGRIYKARAYPIQGSSDQWGEVDLEEVPNVRRDMLNDNVVLQFSDESPMMELPYFYEERIFYDALSATYFTVAAREVGDAATTLCPVDYAAAAMVRVLSEWYVTKQPYEAEFWGGVGGRSQKWLDIWEARHGPPPEPIATRDRTIYVPQWRV